MTQQEKPSDETQPAPATQRKPWAPMTVRYVGDVSDVVQQGGGKLPSMPTDPGEPRKIPPSG